MNDKDDNLNKSIRILNCYEEAKKDNSWIEGINNEKEIKENCELYLNGKKIDFCYKYKFDKEGKYIIKIMFKKILININCIFMDCNKLLSIDLSNFITNNVINMSYMFSGCSSLTYLNLSNFDTSNVECMSNMFHKLSSNCKIETNNKKISDIRNIQF